MFKYITSKLYNALPEDRYVNCNCVGATKFILPELSLGKNSITIKKTDSTSNAITIHPKRYESIDNGTLQVETATVVGTITGTGDVDVVITASGLAGSPITLNVAVLEDDTASTVAEKIRIALKNNRVISDYDVGFFTISGIGALVVLTQVEYSGNDSTLNISIDNGTCTGLTTAGTSANTTAGVAVTIASQNEYVTLTNNGTSWVVIDKGGVNVTETLVNKTLTTPVISSVYKDSAKTKLMTIPDVASDTFATLAAIQTFTNKRLTSPKINEDVALTATATQLNTATAKSPYTSRLYNLGTPVVADDDLIVVSTDMKVGTYTLAADPDVCRNITVTVTAGDTADTMGTITVDGTNYADEVIEEVITPVAGSTVAGLLAFKTVTAITGAGWVIDGVEVTADDIKIGVGDLIGLPIALTTGSEVILGILGTSIVANTVAVGTPATVEESTIDMSASTYNGSKAVIVFIVD